MTVASRDWNISTQHTSGEMFIELSVHRIADLADGTWHIARHPMHDGLKFPIPGEVFTAAACEVVRRRIDNYTDRHGLTYAWTSHTSVEENEIASTRAAALRQADNLKVGQALIAALTGCNTGGTPCNSK